MVSHAIGLMSGTSLDGLDLCFARFEKRESWEFEILEAETLPYSGYWEQRLAQAIDLPSQALLELHSDYGFYLGKSVTSFIERHRLHTIDLISSHGHTVFHQPRKRFTLQIGDGRAVKLETGLPVVYDFRSQDVLMGGNGAPLVPIGDELLFSSYDACLNLGGFSNISMKRNGQRIAFDISPVNTVLNFLARLLGKNFDESGSLARNGTVNRELLARLNALDFYRQPHPKSLGIEWCNRHIFPLLENTDPAVALATFTQHVSEQISEVLNTCRLESVLFTGGGAYNTYLIEKIQSATSARIIIPHKEIIEYKEALIFAFMGVLKMNNMVNVLASATGSPRDHSSGVRA